MADRSRINRSSPGPDSVDIHLTQLRLAQLSVGRFVGEVRDRTPAQIEAVTNFLETSPLVAVAAAKHKDLREACDRLHNRYIELRRRR